MAQLTTYQWVTMKKWHRTYPEVPVSSHLVAWNREESLETSLTEFRHQMLSGDLLAYLLLNCPSSGIVLSAFLLHISRV